MPAQDERDFVSMALGTCYCSLVDDSGRGCLGISAYTAVHKQ